MRTGRHGEWLPDATSDGADPNVDSGYGYMPRGPFTNWAERAEQNALAAHRKQAGEDANLNGVYFTVERVDYTRPEGG
ncbi:hypothetical protein [Microbacterium thalli]|uniref:hypothetical protein n=1 Tax=Microbacterium thalli TaxID=3027921 RepID=UPI00236607EA|nr:hypothetical protein [Microbacterium thalli]MDD7930067.1 hypothetical protein [Microbacterium thalli]